MLVDEDVTDDVLGRGIPGSRIGCPPRLISMGSTAPDSSRGLAAEISEAGGRYVEAPVSGSREPAEAGELVALMGGYPNTVAGDRPLLAPMCHEMVLCGSFGSGL